MDARLVQRLSEFITLCHSEPCAELISVSVQNLKEETLKSKTVILK